MNKIGIQITYQNPHDKRNLLFSFKIIPTEITMKQIKDIILQKKEFSMLTVKEREEFVLTVQTNTSNIGFDMLHEDKTPYENQLNLGGTIYSIFLMKKEAHFSFIETIALPFTPTITAVSTTTTTTTTATTSINKPTVQEIQLQFLYQDDTQVIGCDISAPATTKFIKLASMFCNGTLNFGPATDYHFCYSNVLLDCSKSLMNLGMKNPSKIYQIHVYPKARVDVVE